MSMMMEVLSKIALTNIISFEVKPLLVRLILIISVKEVCCGFITAIIGSFIWSGVCIYITTGLLLSDLDEVKNDLNKMSQLLYINGKRKTQ